MPAIGLAAAVIGRRHPGAVIGSFAADQVIPDGRAFGAAVREAVAVAETGLITTIGIAVHGSRLYVGGRFTTANEVATSGVATHTTSNS